MEVEGGGVSLPQLQERFSLEYTKLYMKIAAVARQQSNYAVCRKYLGLTETAINEVQNKAQKFQDRAKLLTFLKVTDFYTFYSITHHNI